MTAKPYRSGSMLTTPRTDIEMTTSGEWCKTGSKQYRHSSGTTISYEYNRSVWRIDFADGRPWVAYKTLAVARYEATRSR